MHLTWFGHACVLLSGTKKVLIDPFVDEGSIAGIDPDLVLVTHGHFDHLGETIHLKKPTVAIGELAHYLQAKGVPAEGMNIGGTLDICGVRVTMTQALHSSRIDDPAMTGSTGAAAGFVVRMDGVSVYHAGDTGLFSDMKLIGELYHPDVALLPIGGRYTMGTREAMMAAQFVGAKTVVPIHYNTWEKITADAGEFKMAIERTTDLTVKILQPGESLEIPSGA
ncbi:metal-dependent hydrolase [Methanoregula sp.]|uniref:metal-dependent hydrolase n=1 Tax=Methanoregula sp. TaxID=2052170 RepID=UPI002C35ECB9|nr:metal-dependent hydrolase [Methanoregula sp.]HVP96345.1 metal-dependent hydrolase [Methanoregula sp.]